jgi:hypothetical protein
MPMTTAAPRVYVTRSRSKLASGAVREYAYVRLDEWDESKQRYQPKPLASLGRTDALDDDRIDSLGGFLREWLKKDSTLPASALRERFQSLESSFRILCSKDFGLRDLCEQAWLQLGYDRAVASIADSKRVERAIFGMVLIQLVTPCSKRAMAHWAGAHLFFPEGEGLSERDFYAAMDVLAEGYVEVERMLVERLRELGSAGTELALDTTTVSCSVRYDDVERATIEGDRQAQGSAKRAAVVNEPPLRMRGRSKSKRSDLPQVVVEVVAADSGLIVHHDTHAGNTSDLAVPKGTVKALRKLGYKQVRFAGDAGMNSASNRQALRDAGFEFVMGEGLTRTRVVRNALSRAGRYQPHPDKPELWFKCVIACAEEEPDKPERLYVIRWNRHEEAATLHRIQRHLKHVEAEIAAGGAKAERLFESSTYRKYVRRDGRRKDANGKPSGAIRIDRAAIKRMKQRAGKSVIATDCLEAHPLAEDDLYRSLFEVEAIFKQLKSKIAMGPIRHRRADRVRAHVMVAIMAFNLGRWLERRTGLTLQRLRDTLAGLRVQLVEANGARYWERTELDPEQRLLYERLGYHLPPKRFVPNIKCP